MAKPRHHDSHYHNTVAPPFLNKTYDLVEDPITNDIVSWGPEGNRVSEKSILTNGNSLTTALSELAPYNNLSDDLETLKRDKNILVGELRRMRQQQQASDLEIQNLYTKLEDTNRNQQQMMVFMSRVLQNPNFLQHLIQSQGIQRLGSGDVGTLTGRKKRRAARLGGDMTVADVDADVDNTSALIHYQAMPMGASPSKGNANETVGSSMLTSDSFLMDDNLFVNNADARTYDVSSALGNMNVGIDSGLMGLIDGMLPKDGIFELPNAAGLNQQSGEAPLFSNFAVPAAMPAASAAATCGDNAASPSMRPTGDMLDMSSFLPQISQPLATSAAATSAEMTSAPMTSSAGFMGLNSDLFPEELFYGMQADQSDEWLSYLDGAAAAAAPPPPLEETHMSKE